MARLAKNTKTVGAVVGDLSALRGGGAMKRGLALPVAIAVFAAGASLWAGNVTWRGVDDVWDGYWNDSAHWSNATDPTGLPGAGDYSRIYFTNGGTVSIPGGGVTTQAEMCWYAYAGGEATLDATGSSFTIGAADPDHPYGTDSNKRPWYMWLDNISLGWISYNVSSYEDIKYLSVLQLVNARITTRGTLGECAEITFEGQGTGVSSLDMCDPVGGRKTGALPSFDLFAASQYQDEQKYPVARVSFKDIDATLPSFTLNGYPLDLGCASFSGGKSTVLGSMTFSLAENPRLGESRVVATDNAEVTFKGETFFPRLRPCRFVADEGSSISFGSVRYNSSLGANMGFSARNGSTLAFRNDAQIGMAAVSVDGVPCCSTASVCVVDSTMRIGAAKFEFGNSSVNEGAHSISLAFTNAVVVATNAANSTDVYLYNGEVTSKNSDWTASILTLKANNPNVPADFTFDGGTMGISNRLELLGWSSATAAACTNRFVQKSGKIHVANGKRFNLGDGYNTSIYELKGGELEIENGTIIVANQTGGRGELIVDGEDAHLNIKGTAQHIVNGNTARSVGILRLKNGRIDIYSGTYAHRAFTPHAANATSIVEIAGGTFCASSGYGLGATFGTAIIDISGGDTTLPRFAIGTEYSTTPESVVTISGGVLTVPAASPTTLYPEEQLGIQATGNKGTNRLVRLRFNGGTVNANRVVAGVGSRCNGGMGWTVFEGDGGRIVLNGTGHQMINGFDEAKLGEKGIVIDSNGYATHIRQNFSDMAGQQGRLVLAGSGVKTLYGTDSSESVLVAAGGTVEFAPNARHASALVVTNGAAVTFSDAAANGVTSLTVGDGTTPGVLNLTAGTTIAVDGPIVMNNVRLVLSGTFATDNDYTLISSTQAFDEGTKRAWKDAIARGLGDSQACDLVDAVDGSGNYILKMHVRAARDLVITVDAGTSNVAEDVVFDPMEHLTTVVARDATLNLQGSVRRGGLIKEGEGRTVLSGAGNLFCLGLTVSGGMLEGTTLGALGFGTSEVGTPLSLGTATISFGSAGESGRSPYSLVLNTGAATDAAVIQCNADVTMDAPVFTQGCTIKRGPGRLVYEANDTVTLGVNGGKQTNKDTNPDRITIVFDTNGVPPSVQYTTLNVAEGDLVLKGTGPNAHFRLGTPNTQVLASTYVGMPVRGIERQARLVVDGAKATLQNAAHFHLGSGCAGSTSDATAPSLVLTNGATFVTTSFQNGRNADVSYHGRVFVDGSTLDFTEYIYALRAGVETPGEPTWTFTNGAQLLSPNDNNHAVEFNGSACTMVFDNSTFKGRSGVSSGRGRVFGAGANGKMVFRNGSVFKCDTFVWTGGSSTVTLEFDDGAWDPSDSSYTFSAGDNQSRLIVKAVGSGRGLVLAPPSGATWTMAQTVSGDGGVTKEGPGTLAFTVAPTFTGVLDVSEGTVSFDGLSIAGMKLKGSGTVSGGTLSSCTYKVAMEDGGNVPEMLDFSGVAFSGRTKVDLGRTEETALPGPYARDVLVATYTGSAPDVSGWRVINTGVPGLVGSFTAVNGEIRMNFTKATGTVITFR